MAMFKQIKFQTYLGVALAVISLLSGFYAFFFKPPAVLLRDSGAEAWEQRMKPVKRALPADVWQVGYISDLDLVTDLIEQQFFTELDEFPLTMYSMAPRLVSRGLNFEWIIGNFTNPDFEKFLDENLPNGYELQNLGFGIYLVHVEQP